MPPVYGNPSVVNAVDVQAHLALRPLTSLKQTTFSRDRLLRSEYRQCRCGCSFRMIISFSPDGVTSTIRETDIPVGHVDVEENPDTRERDKEIHDIIDKLIESNKYAKNFGPKRIIDELRRQHISDSRIPSEKQLQNKLHYYRRTKFNFTNEITPLEVKLRQFQFTNNESEEQSFIYHYRTDKKDRLILGDGSER